MVKMLSTINDSTHLRKIAIETTTNTSDVSLALRNTMVSAKYRLASTVTMVETIAMIIARAMSNKVIIEMHQVLADKIIDPGFHGHTTCHPKNTFEWTVPDHPPQVPRPGTQ
jgi:hypothetical protein